MGALVLVLLRVDGHVIVILFAYPFVATERMLDQKFAMTETSLEPHSVIHLVQERHPAIHAQEEIY